MIDQFNFKRYFWSFFGVIGIVAFWAGVWDGIGFLPYLEHWYISLVVGLIILASSGLILKEFSPLSDAEKAVHQALGKVFSHPRKQEFHIKYYDEFKKKHIVFKGDKLKMIEKSFIILKHPRKEIFIPVHRVKEILHKQKSHWKS